MTGVTSDHAAEYRRIGTGGIQDDKIGIRAQSCNRLIQAGRAWLVDHPKLGHRQRDAQIPGSTIAIGQAPLQRPLAPIEVDRDHPRSRMGKGNGNMKGQCRFADAAFLVGEGYDVGVQSRTLGQIGDHVAGNLVVPQA